MISKYILSNVIKPKRCTVSIVRYSNNALDIEKLDQDTSSHDVIDNEALLKEEAIQRKRNKSRLNTAHRNILQGSPPYTEPKHPVHDTLKYKRKLYGKYGNKSGIDAALCWPTKEELSNAIEFERVAYPHSIHELIEASKKDRQAKEEGILKRESDIASKMLKLDVWIKDLNMKIAKKEAESQEAKERKERLIEEVRRHFGYTIDPRDERFKEMLEKKEKEQKKVMKEARKKAKEEKMITKILLKKDGESVENRIENKD